MTGLTKVIFLTVVASCIAILAKVLPIVPIGSEVHPTSATPRQEFKTIINTRKLVSIISEDSLFVSKSQSVTDSKEVIVAEKQTVDWSPLDYTLIGVSVSPNRKTGWFKNNEDGRLVSARHGSQLGGWVVVNLTSTQAALKNGTETISLKLFTGADPR